MEDKPPRLTDDQYKKLANLLYPKPTPVKDFLSLIAACFLVPAMLCWPLSFCWNMGPVEVCDYLSPIEPLDMFFIFAFVMLTRLTVK